MAFLLMITRKLVILLVLGIVLCIGVSDATNIKSVGSINHAVVQTEELREESSHLARLKGHTSGPPKHKLRICNAYPTEAALDISKNSRVNKLTEAPLAYKACLDVDTQLSTGDKIVFSVGDVEAGTFSVSGLPANDSILFLAIHRHDDTSTAVSFVSHVFANLLNAQIAIIDTYKGANSDAGKHSVRIKDIPKSGGAGRIEDLRYNSVVAVNPGKYEAMLLGKDDKAINTKPIVTINRESYVILRVGVEAKEGKSFPMELVVFPKTDEKKLKNSAMRTTLSTCVFGVVMSIAATLMV